MAEFLLELFSEEIPARMQGEAAESLHRLFLKGMAARGFDEKSLDAKTYVTPRRLTLVANGVPTRQPDQREERKGPRTNAPAAAIEGFLRSTGMTREQLKVENDGKSEFYLAVIEKKGGHTSDVLAELIAEIVKSFPWPKSMRWAGRDYVWVRPLRGIVALLDGKLVNVTIGDVASGHVTGGHRQMAPGPISVSGFADYREKLHAAKVILDVEDRKREIIKGAKAEAARAGLIFRDDPDLLDEVAGLVEWPVVLTCGFEKEFLDVPAEVLVSTMRKNQKYFALYDLDGRLANAFLVVSNLVADDGGKAIIAGNERVVRARLSDARFFWEQDKKITLWEQFPKLRSVIFHAKIGTLFDRVLRVSKLSREIAEFVGTDPLSAERAAQLCKSDLLSGTVGEFPELQGVVGGYLAKNEGLAGDYILAISQQYRPQGESDGLPIFGTAAVVALADKIELLSSFFEIGERPTGSKDPFGMRRAAIGICRIILDLNLRLHLSPLWKKSISMANAMRNQNEVGQRVAAIADANFKLGSHAIPIDFEKLYWSQLNDSITTFLESEQATGIHADLVLFMADRLKVVLRDKGTRHDLIDAVFALPDQDDLVLIVRRVEALQSFLATDDGKNLLAGYKRAANILRIEEKKDKRTYGGAVNPALLNLPQELALAAALDHAVKHAGDAVGREDFAAAMAALSALRAPVDAFFDKVTVNDADPALRENRLNLLSRIKLAAHEVADFSKIEG